MIGALFALILAILAPANAIAKPERGQVHPAAPLEQPALADLPADVWSDGCTYTRLQATTITARHCVPWNATELGWTVSGDRAWQGPPPLWAGDVPRGATVWAVGYPHANGRTVFTLTALQVQQVPVAGRLVPVLMTFGDGVPCGPGASGMVGFVAVDGVAMPVGPLAAYSTDPEVTGLPVGQFVCGFAI